MEHSPPLPPPAKSEILGHLKRMLARPDFGAKPQQIALLKYMVNIAIDGKARDIAEDTLAVEIFGRGPDFDPNVDPIVSIQVDLLRRALIRYNQTAGKNDPVRIVLPSGTYAPVLKTRNLKEF